MDELEYKKHISELERENRILKQKLKRNEANRAMLEEMLETHSNTLNARNAELEKSRELIKKSEERYKELALRDALTRLPNRTFFFECLVQSITRAKCSNSCIALLFIDLDRFKPINDNFGHEAGDMVLGQIAERLLACVRNRATVARIGGDEFAILIEDFPGHQNVARIGDRIINMLSKPFSISGNVCQIGVSIGISVYPHDDEDPDGLLQKADLAMYSVKKSCCNNYRFYRDIG
jgi:diguanylate cyclase (GGDEF)-like protein